MEQVIEFVNVCNSFEEIRVLCQVCIGNQFVMAFVVYFKVVCFCVLIGDQIFGSCLEVVKCILFIFLLFCLVEFGVQCIVFFEGGNCINVVLFQYELCYQLFLCIVYGCKRLFLMFVGENKGGVLAIQFQFFCVNYVYVDWCFIVIF